MRIKNIYAVMKDNGGMNNVLPVCRELMARGQSVRIFTNGITNELMKNSGLDFYPLETVQEMASNHPSPDLLITSICSEGGIGRDIVPILRGVCPIVAVQDYWGAYLVSSWADSQFRPDHISVNDKFGADLVIKAWPEFDSSHIHQTGFPHFDKYSSIDLSQERAARNQIRNQLQIPPESVIVFFPCGILTGASQMLEEVLYATGNLAENFPFGDYALISRPHPNLKKIAPEESEPWDNLIAKFDEYFPGIVVNDSVIIREDIKILLLASDIVVSDFSTTLLEAGLVGSALQGRANISVLYPRPARALFKSSFRTLIDEPPYVTMGCTAKAEDRKHLADLFRSCLGHNDLASSLADNQKKYLVTDGHNTERVADLVESLME